MGIEPSKGVEKVEHIEIPDYGGKHEGGSRGGQLKQFIAPLIISLIVTFGMVNLLFIPQLVSKTDFTANILAVTNDIAGIKSSLAPIGTQLAQVAGSINSLSQDIASVKGSLGGYATIGSVSGFQASINSIQSDLNSVKSSLSTLSGLPADVASVKATVASLQTTVSGLQTTVNSLQASLTTLTARVAKMETPSATSGNLTIAVARQSDYITLFYTGTDTANATASIRFKVTNNSAKDIYYDAEVVIDFDDPIKYTKISADGWEVDWNDADGVVLYKDMVRVRANSTVFLNLTLILDGISNFPSTKGVGYDFDYNVTS